MDISTTVLPADLIMTFDSNNMGLQVPGNT